MSIAERYFERWFTVEQSALRELQLEMLLQLYGRKNQLVFKGGTALDLFHGSGRFSEDLDFDCQAMDGLLEINKAVDGIKKDGKYSIYNKWDLEREMHNRFIRYNVRISSKEWEHVANLVIDLTVDKPMYPPNRIPLKYKDSVVSVNVMQLQEILAEKVCAIMGRKKARDLYDLHFLAITKRVPINLKDIYEKCEMFAATFPKAEQYSYKTFEARVNGLKGSWRELSPLLESTKGRSFAYISSGVLDAFRSL